MRTATTKTALAALALGALCPATLLAVAPPPLVVSQKNRVFAPRQIEIRTGDSLRFTNEDEFLHQVFVDSAGFRFNSKEQSPGETVDVKFTTAGEFQVLCGIHPKMLLTVQVR
jgi:plastocyanin